MWDSVEAILQKKLIALNVYIEKKTNHECYEWFEIFPYLHANMVSSVLAGTRHNTPESETEDSINGNSSSQNISICDDSLSPSSHRVI